MQLAAENQERLALHDELCRTPLLAQIGRLLAVVALRWFSHIHWCDSSILVCLWDDQNPGSLSTSYDGPSSASTLDTACPQSTTPVTLQEYTAQQQRDR